MPRSALNLFFLFVVQVLACCGGYTIFAQQPWDATAFANMANEQRYQYIHDYPFWKVHNHAGGLSTLLNDMLRIAKEKKDKHTILGVELFLCFASGPEGVDLPKGYNSYTLFQEVEKTAKNEYPVEALVARFHLTQHPYNPHFSNYLKKYTDIQELFEQMQSIGFEKFRDYDIDRILLDMAMFMWDLEDYEKAVGYLSVAEKFIKQIDGGGHTYTQVLSYLQTYWKQKKEYGKSLDYAYQINWFHQHITVDDAVGKWWNDFWKGFSTIEIADILIKQGKFIQGEQFADKGYLLSKTSAHAVDEVSASQAEFDALQVLIDVKLQLHKLNEADLLLQRALQIKDMLEAKGRLDYFKPLRLYQCMAEYNERVGLTADALKYTHLAQQLQDSLNIRNDAHKLAKAQQRFEAEKYAQKIAVVEKEKRFEKMLKNAAVAILLLTLALGFVYYKNVQISKRQKESELNNAIQQLGSLTQSFKEKSEQVDQLHLAHEALSTEGKKSEYLEQLLNTMILTDEDWKNFKTLFEKVHPNFITEQKKQFPTITPAEIRLTVLEKLGLNTREMANTLGVNKNTIHQTRLRLRKKMEDGAA